MQIPSPRGPLSRGVIRSLTTGSPPDTAELSALAREVPREELLRDDDLHLALWVLYELHYGGFDGVDPGREWDPELIRLRGVLEGLFETELRRAAEPHVRTARAADGPLAERLFALAAGFEGVPVARFVQREASLEQFREFMVHRSVYHLKESDPHSWVIPRITGGPKAALVELQYDEYGGGRPARLHATMFGDSLAGCGLDRTYGAYLDLVPGPTLASNNAMSLLGLNRRLRGAAMGHLGAFEATSSLPCRKYAGGVRRLGLPEVVAAYFDEHVEADAVHEQVALRDICEGLVASGQATEDDVVLGAAVCLLMDDVAGAPMLAAWQQGRSSLRAPLGRLAGAAAAVAGSPTEVTAVAS
jgi:hypothetical protein